MLRTRFLKSSAKAVDEEKPYFSNVFFLKSVFSDISCGRNPIPTITSVNSDDLSNEITSSFSIKYRSKAKKSFKLKFDFIYLLFDKLILKVVPFPTSEETIRRSPPWYSLITLFARESPSPQPLFLVENPGLKTFLI